MSDIIIPHFGGGYNDHRRKGTTYCYVDKLDYESNIHNAKDLIMARIR